jgi:hypothetical protein
MPAKADSLLPLWGSATCPCTVGPYYFKGTGTPGDGPGEKVNPAGVGGWNILYVTWVCLQEPIELIGGRWGWVGMQDNE